ncbi:MAG: hypothetical protein WCK15_16610 [Pirellula sp.]
MSSQLVSSSGCCTPCDTTPIVVNIPGPQGATGTAGTNGTNGINSFCTTTASFITPALGASVFAYVNSTDFLPESVAGQFFVSVQGLGYMQITSVDGLRLTLQNPASGLLSIPNAIPTTVIPIGSLISLAGAIGPQGTPGLAGGASSAGTYIVRVPDASIPSATALNSLSAGYVKTLGSSGSGAINTSATIPVADISGVLTVAKGGTGVATVPTNGQIPIGNGSGYTVASLTAGANITITPGAGTITIASGTATFNYVTFTRRVTGSALSFLTYLTLRNPFSLADFPSGTWSTLDSASGFVAATGRYVVPYTGYYKIDVVLNISTTPSPSTTLEIKKNGASIFTSLAFTPGAAEAPIAFSYIDQASNVGDYYEVSITAANTLLAVNAGSSFSVQRIQA